MEMESEMIKGRSTAYLLKKRRPQGEEGWRTRCGRRLR